MIQKIQGEQPFQILSDAFSIGPSNTGYELQISADGSHFSTLFTVGANTTRLVSNVANGSFYRLKNNVGEVAVNWRTTCKGGGSGGSGSTVSVNQILSAGTEIAQISVDGVPTSLYAPEGGEGGGNVIGVDYSEIVSSATFPVNEIISAATEGDLVYMTYKPNGVRSIKYMYLNQIMGTSQKSFRFSGNGDDGNIYSTTILYDEGTGIVTPSSVTRTPIAADGIRKVNELPASAETGDVVWLNGKSYTGYTILCATDARPAYVYELYRSNVVINGNETSMRMGDFNTGAWVSWEGVMVRPRVQETTDYPLLDVIDPDGTHTIAVGENAISMETGVTFPMKGCLYEYLADGWFRKARFEHIYEGAADGLALIQKIQYGIEEFGFEDFVLRFSPDKNGEREFMPYSSTFYGIDFQATDSRNRDQEWGRISCRNYRLSPSDGSFTDLVGEKWIVCESRINIPQIVGVNINSAGTITEASGLDLLSSMFNVSNRVCFHCDINEDNKFSSAPLKWWYRQNEQVDGDTKLFYYACAEIPIEGTVYKGVWKWAENEYPEPFVPQSWTVVQ